MYLGTYKAGSTSNILDIPFYDSSSTVGAKLSGVTSASSGLTIYWRTVGAATDNTVTPAAGTLGTYTSGGIVEDSSANYPGNYQFGAPDAMFASAGKVKLYIQGVANMVAQDYLIEIEANLISDLFSSTINTTGALPYLGILDSGTAQSAAATDIVLSATSPLTANTATGATVAAEGATQGYFSVRTFTGYTGATFTGTVDTWDVTPSGVPIKYLVYATPPASASSPAPANMTQIGGVTQSATDLKDFADTGYDPATHKVQGVALADTITTYTGNTPQTGDSYALVSTLSVKKNTALSNFQIYMVSSTDHVTPKTALTGFTVTLSLDGVQSTITPTITELGLGFYTLNLTAANLNGNNVGLLFEASGADPKPYQLITQP